MSAREIVDQSSPAVVIIEATGGDSGGENLGTGFVVDGRGIIATNLHVIAGRPEIKIRMHDGGEYAAQTIVNFDQGHDLALVRILPKSRLPAVRLGDSNQVSAGDKIYAIGNPLGVFDYSVSDGLISQVRPITADLTILQISAPISQGSSGGPLFNQFGEVIGVTTAIITGERDAPAQSINLAVPANYLRPLIAQPGAIALADFAEKTKDVAPEHEEHAAASDEDNVQIHRDVPDHPVTVWDGCNEADVEEIAKAIASAIETGAPAYNRQSIGRDKQGYDPHGYEACYRIYEGTALKYEQNASCKGVRQAFGDGLLRAGSMKTFKEKAWAMRDTFDGLIQVAEKWAQQKPPPPPHSSK
jgi:hypothetical protein